MKDHRLLCSLLLAATTAAGAPTLAAQAGEWQPAAQAFRQEIARTFDGLPAGEVQLIEAVADGSARAFAGGRWFACRGERWEPLPDWTPASDGECVVADGTGTPIRLALPWRDVRQVLRSGERLWVATERAVHAVVGGKLESLGWPERHALAQLAAGPGGELWAASGGGLFQRVAQDWTPAEVSDGQGRRWAVREVLGAAFDSSGQLWFATRAGVGCRTGSGWRFYEGGDGLPWNDFTGIAPGPDGEVWFATRLGAIRFDRGEWHYRQGPRWLPHDDVRQIAVGPGGAAWLATAAGAGRIERRPTTLAEKAALYEAEIERYIKRTPYGYVAEAPLRRAGDKASADPQDSDNDGLWTAMYGAGECFAYAATRDPQAKERARKAFDALRFLQKVTQGGPNAPPQGFVARTIRPIDWPEPNAGRAGRDRASQRGDRLWKVIEPRWPRSADGEWYWKCDTSSDELDGHFFFYPLYYDFCADTEAERERVRDVVRQLADHLIEHDYVLTDHDGLPTRWAIYGPRFLNNSPDWWPESGLNSLSILSYLAVAAHVTGEAKYEAASRELVERHGYAQNAMYPKVQQGPGSGNQSDDEMAFMCYYSLLRCSRDEPLKAQIRWSFFQYWVNEAPEMNPLFNFAYAAHNLGARGENPFGEFGLDPWDDWHEDAMATLYGLPLDRLSWPHRNSHRLDIERLAPAAARDIYEPPTRGRGYRAGGKVLPVENRHFNHWNTDPWQLDYRGDGGELAAGTVFLLPYYMGLYHGFIAKP